MKYLFRPIRDAFKFTGTASRTEYFVFALSNAAFVAFVLFASIVNYAILPSINLPFFQNTDFSFGMSYQVYTLVQFAFIHVASFPMLALTVRRLRDQNANKLAIIWFFIPIIGPIALFIMGFMPKFLDYIVTLPDGQEIWRSEQLQQNRRMGAIIAGTAILAGGSAIYNGVQDSVGGMEIQGGKKVTTPGAARLLNNNGTLNKKNVIGGGTKAHMRNGRAVKAHKNKYKL